MNKDSTQNAIISFVIIVFNTLFVVFFAHSFQVLLNVDGNHNSEVSIMYFGEHNDSVHVHLLEVSVILDSPEFAELGIIIIKDKNIYNRIIFIIIFIIIIVVNLY